MRLRTWITLAAGLAVSSGLTAAGGEKQGTSPAKEDWVCIADPVDGGWDCGRGAAPVLPAAPTPPPGVRPRSDYAPEVRPLTQAGDPVPEAAGAAPDSLFGSTPLTRPQPGANPEAPIRATPDEGPAPEAEPPTSSAVAPTASGTGDYVIQLMGGVESESADAFIQTHGLAGHVTRMQIMRQGVPWYIVLLGPYPDFETARTALFSLPDELQAAGPWIRRLSEIQ